MNNKDLLGHLSRSFKLENNQKKTFNLEVTRNIIHHMCQKWFEKYKMKNAHWWVVQHPFDWSASLIYRQKTWTALQGIKKYRTSKQGRASIPKKKCEGGGRVWLTAALQQKYGLPRLLFHFLWVLCKHLGLSFFVFEGLGDFCPNLFVSN